MIYIILVNYNSFLFTKKCIDSIYKSNFKKYKVIVIDNNSTDNSVIKINEYIESSNKDLKFISNDVNDGYAAGINIGIKHSISNKDCKYLFILNNDTLITTNCLNDLVDNYKKNTIVAPSIFDYDDHSKIQSFGGIVNKYILTTKHLKTINISKIDYIPGTAMFFHKNIINTLGLLPEEYFMYYEDVDWSTHAKINKISLTVNDKAIVYHKQKESISFAVKARTIFNRILYCNKYFRYKLPLVIILSLINIFFNLIRRK